MELEQHNVVDQAPNSQSHSAQKMEEVNKTDKFKRKPIEFTNTYRKYFLSVFQTNVLNY